MTNSNASGPGVAALAVCLAAGAAATAVLKNPAPFFVGAVVGVYCMLSIKVVRQWEKVAVLRLGRYIGLRGPGMFWIIPIIDTLTPYVTSASA
jgi:regulator of protease activity HflC (stomatin/prohibitin superfamily)